MMAIISQHDDEHGRGGMVQVAKLTKTPYAYLNAIKNRSGNPPRGMGDDVARRFEDAFGKPKGWMDRAHLDGHKEEEQLDAEESELISIFRPLSTEQKLAVLAIVRQIPPAGKKDT
jgi:hypothetical protein